MEVIMECNEMTACKVIENLTTHADMGYFSEHLHEMFLSFVKEYEGHDRNYKAHIVNTYECLREHIQEIEMLQKQQHTLR